jgi:tRNA pseudouridine55 synthase
MSTAHAPKTPAALAALTLGALGVVYGDIGTSPLYALKEVFHAGHVATSPDNILGVLSLIFWTMTIIVSVKYVLLILRADNNGEGGLIAMLALATTAVKDRPQLRSVLMAVGLFGTAIFYGDGVITPAISVLSAVEGLKTLSIAKEIGLDQFVLPIAIGAATRLLPYLPGDKGYVGVVQLGLTTSSDDLEGEELERRAVPALAPEQLELALAALRGPILQRPPRVSAVHVQGQRAYALARRGEDFELAERPVTIHRLELLGWDGERGRLELAVDCSSGTYVRALARDLGERLGCGGCLAGLRRTTALGFGLDGAVPLERLESGPPPPLLDPLPALAALPRQQLNAEQLLGWRCGRGLAAAAGLAAGGPVAVLDPAGQLAGIGLAGPAGEAGGEAWLRPKLVLQASG